MSNNSRGGPKTALGKKRASSNSLRHGLFAAAFSLSGPDKVEFHKLEADLREVLRPQNALLDLSCQDVVACAWRMRGAFRYEQGELLKQFSTESEESPEEPQGVGVLSPYRTKARKSEAIKLLDELKIVAQQRGSLPAEFEKDVTLAFGADLWKTLTEWMTLDGVNAVVCRMAAVAVARSQDYGIDLPNANVSSEEEKKFREACTRDQQQMLCKIIEIYKNLLVSTLHHPEKGGGALLDERLSRLDLALRYQTTARRDFYRSLHEYWENWSAMKRASSGLSTEH